MAKNDGVGNSGDQQRHALIGRADELRHLQSVVERSATGDVHVAVVEGTAGVGKTRLINDALADVGARPALDANRDGVPSHVVVRCRCQQHNPPAFLPFIRLLRQIERLDSLSDEIRQSARLGLQLLTGDIARGGVAHSADRFRSRLFLAVADAVRAVRAAANLVIVVDDSQWIDQASASLLDFVLDDLFDDTVTHAATLIIGTRGDDPANNRTWSFEAAGAPHQSSHLKLAALDATEVLDLVLSLGMHGPDPEWLAAVTTASRGNPLHVIEQTQARLADGGSGWSSSMVGGAQLDTIIEKRLAALSDEEQGVLSSCALLDLTFSRDDVDAVSASTRLEVDGALIAGLREGLLVRNGSQYSFAHDLWRSHLYLQITPAERKTAHDKIAFALIAATERATGDNRAAEISRIGRHLRNGQRNSDELVVRWCAQAGDIAWSSTAWHEAAAEYEAALHAAQRLGDTRRAALLQAKAARSHVCNANAGAARALFADLAASAKEAGDIENWAIGVSGEARLRTAFSSDGLRGTVPTESLRDFLRQVDDPRHRALVLTEWANSETTAGNARRGAQLATDALLAATSVEADRSAALFAAGYAYLVALDPERAVDHLRACELLRRNDGHDWAWAESLSRLAWAHLFEGDLALAIDVGTHAVEVAQRASHLSDAALAETAMAAAYLALGDFDSALAAGQTALRHAYRTTYHAAPHLLFPVLLSVHRLCGRGDDANRVIDIWRQKGVGGRRTHELLLSADLYPSNSDFELRCPPIANLGTLGTISSAAELVGLGNNIAAADELHGLITGLDHVVFTTTGQSVDRLRALIEMANGQHERANASVDLAISRCERVGARGELAQAHLLRARISSDPQAQRISGLLGRALAEEVGLAPHRRSTVLGEIPAHDDEHDRDEVTILFSDLAGSTALSVERGDLALVRAIEQSRSILRARCVAFGGNEFGTEGDGFLAWFEAAEDAVACAEAVLNDVAASGVSDSTGVSLKIGISTGRPVLHNGDVFGKAVNLAARLSDRAGPNELIIDTRSVALATSGYHFAAQKPVDFKGFPEPLPVFTLVGRRTKALAPSAARPDLASSN